MKDFIIMGVMLPLTFTLTMALMPLGLYFDKFGAVDFAAAYDLSNAGVQCALTMAGLMAVATVVMAACTYDMFVNEK